MTTEIAQDAPLKVGIGAGAGLITCMAGSLLVPPASNPFLGLGSFFAIVALANSWLAVNRNVQTDTLGGMRGVTFCSALLYSLAVEVARLLGCHTLNLPGPSGHGITIDIPTPMITEVLACALILLDPLLFTPFMRWLAEGAQSAGGSDDQN